MKSGIDPEVVPSTTTLSVDPAAVAVRRGTANVSVDVASEAGTPTGEVEIYVDNVLASTVELADDGTATASVGPFPTVGTRSVSARYLGDATTEPSASEAATVSVRKATAKVAAKAAPKKVKAGVTKARLVVAVRAPGFTPTGKVRVKINKLIGKKNYVGKAAQRQGHHPARPLPEGRHRQGDRDLPGRRARHQGLHHRADQGGQAGSAVGIRPRLRRFIKVCR
ncbi:Ig-like domain-containing protein [Nocardioides sp. TF02-7]|uniref:Ig-like domain-containing protein n=1 Tax=Nocardioides sp. TF02-7 TaxID=2917724 RepID=UPI0023DBC556|nr:Ig-like domain-containing protein [Nocardioides sp. TF02-7]